MRSKIFSLPPEHLALINSLLRRKEISTLEVAHQTFALSGFKSERAWECCLYRYCKRKYQYLVVRDQNLIKDPFVVSDLVIAGLESSLEHGVVNWQCLTAAKTAKVGPTSLMDKLTGDILAKIAANDAEKPDCST